MRFLIVLCLFGFPPLLRAMETRVYGFTNMPPASVETQIRRWVPEKQRVLVNVERSQVMVMADTETHARIAQWLRRVDRPIPKLMIRIRLNREWSRTTWLDGAPATLPISFTPPADLVEEARARLRPGKESMPVTAAALQVKVSLLRDDPPTARMNVTPALVFGKDMPYEVVTFDELSADVMITTDAYVDLPETLAGHAFYPRFFRTQPEASQPARPVGLLLSFEGLLFESEPLETPEL